MYQDATLYGQDANEFELIEVEEPVDAGVVGAAVIGGLGAGIAGALAGSAIARRYATSPFWGGVAGFFVLGPLVGAAAGRAWQAISPE